MRGADKGRAKGDGIESGGQALVVGLAWGTQTEPWIGRVYGTILLEYLCRMQCSRASADGIDDRIRLRENGAGKAAGRQQLRSCRAIGRF